MGVGQALGEAGLYENKARLRALEMLFEDAQVGVTGRLLSYRPFGICHTRYFSFSSWPCLWVSPWHMGRQTSMKWSCPGDLLEPLECLFHDTRILSLPEARLFWAERWVEPLAPSTEDRYPHHSDDVTWISWTFTTSCFWQVVITS